MLDSSTGPLLDLPRQTGVPTQPPGPLPAEIPARSLTDEVTPLHLHPLWQARISHGGQGHGPRIHGLRHTFAVNNLRAWFAAGEDVNALLPVLQAYLGHCEISDTAYYLRLTAESYPHIAARVQRQYGPIVPPLTAGPSDGD